MHLTKQEIILVLKYVGVILVFGELVVQKKY